MNANLSWSDCLKILKAAGSLGGPRVVAACILLGTKFEWTGVAPSIRRRPDEEIGESICGLFTDLGGIFPKLGQNLAERPDLISSEAIRTELKKLQSSAIEMTKAELNNMLKSFETTVQDANLWLEGFQSEPFAAASVGQVHKLKDSKVIKIIKVDQERKVNDQKGVVDYLEKMQLPGKAGMIAQTVKATFEAVQLEFNLQEEGRHFKEGKDMVRVFQSTSSRFQLYVPDVHYCSRTFMIMDDLYSRNGSNCETIKFNDFLARSDVPFDIRMDALKTIMHFWGEMIFRHGFFHCDPHGGNLYVNWFGEDATNWIAIIDWGGSCKLPENIVEPLVKLCLAADNHEGAEAIAALELQFKEGATEVEQMSFGKLLVSTIAHAAILVPRDAGEDSKEANLPVKLPVWVVQLLRVLSMFGNYAHSLRAHPYTEVPDLGRATSTPFFDAYENDLADEPFHSDFIWPQHAKKKAEEKKATLEQLTLQQLKDAGRTLPELKDAGYTVHQLKDAGFTLQQFKDAAYSTKDLRPAGFTLTEWKVAGYTFTLQTVQQLKAAGYTSQQLKDEGYTLQQLKDEGYGTKDLRDAGCTLQQLKDAGYTLQQLTDAGFTVQQLTDAGYTLQQF